MNKNNLGLIHIYTGNGKGKTTSAIGLAVRAAGCGMRIYIGQFLKKEKCGEHKILNILKENIKVEQYGRKQFAKPKKLDAIDFKLARNGFKKSKSALFSEIYNIVILDEINEAVNLGLIPLADAIELIDRKPEYVELILTGRNAHKKLIEKADLVSEIKEIKHYFNKGVKARKGIEK